MTTLEDKIFTLKQNNLMKKMKEIHFADCKIKLNK